MNYSITASIYNSVNINDGEKNLTGGTMPAKYIKTISAQNSFSIFSTSATTAGNLKTLIKSNLGITPNSFKSEEIMVNNVVPADLDIVSYPTVFYDLTFQLSGSSRG